LVFKDTDPSPSVQQNTAPVIQQEEAAKTHQHSEGDQIRYSFIEVAKHNSSKELLEL
jgi:hypothetical protein